MILNIYKPKNYTSFDVVAKIRGLLRERLKTKKVKNPGLKGDASPLCFAKPGVSSLSAPKVKVGHAGTLDPLAEGVLIVLTHGDTKKQDELMNTTKEYKCKIGFGVWSPTYDLEGELEVQSFLPEFAELQQKLPSTLQKFTGEIAQTAPPYSAKKVGGERLYKKARAGTIDDVKLPVKTVTIHKIEVNSFEIKEIAVNDAKLNIPVLTCTVTCSSGTYIRSLAHDIGLELGTKGVLLDLVRTKVGDFKIEDSIKIENIAEMLKPITNQAS